MRQCTCKSDRQITCIVHPHRDRSVPLWEAEKLHREAIESSEPALSKPVVRSNKTSASKRGIMYLDSVFEFGKYSGKKKLQEVIDSDMGYIDWLIENDVVEFDNEAYIYIRHIKQP